MGKGSEQRKLHRSDKKFCDQYDKVDMTRKDDYPGYSGTETPQGELPHGKKCHIVYNKKA